jgi:hypothetical protein
MLSNALNTRRPSMCYGATRAIPSTTIHQSQMRDPEIPLPNRGETHPTQKKNAKYANAPNLAGAAE